MCCYLTLRTSKFLILLKLFLFENIVIYLLKFWTRIVTVGLDIVECPSPQTIVILFVEGVNTIFVKKKKFYLQRILFFERFLHFTRTSPPTRTFVFFSPSCLISNYGRVVITTSITVRHFRRPKFPLKAGRQMACTLTAIFVGQLNPTGAESTFNASLLDDKNNTKTKP